MLNQTCFVIARGLQTQNLVPIYSSQVIPGVETGQGHVELEGKNEAAAMK
jgi:hypothetical protein